MVSAAAMVDIDNKVLIAQRQKDKFMADYWEFPGGKLEVGETEFEGIKREIKEELDCEIEPIKILGNAFHKYERGTVNIIAIKCKQLSRIKLLEHSACVWLKRENLKSLVWAPADEEIILKYLK